jgi:threonyl-tRNA synthetase
VDARTESIGRRIREAELQKVPYMLVIGDREAQEGTVAVRRRHEGDEGTLTLEAFAERLEHETATRVGS